MKALLLLVAIFCHAALIAQNTTFVTVKAGAKVMDVLSMADVFYYPEFTSGRVFFRDGSGVEAKLNYNCLFDEMHFIDPRGDTLALANEKTIRIISIGRDTFYYDGGYIRLLAGNDVVKLADKQVWRVGEGRMTGAFNASSSTSSITSFTTYAAGGSRYGLVVNEDVDLSKANHYYFGDKYNSFVLAGKKNLLMLFPKEQRQIELYLKENKVNFSKREDLEKLLQFLGHL